MLLGTREALSRCQRVAPWRLGGDSRPSNEEPPDRAVPDFDTKSYIIWLREVDLNHRPSGYELGELLDAAIGNPGPAMRNHARLPVAGSLALTPVKATQQV